MARNCPYFRFDSPPRVCFLSFLFFSLSLSLSLSEVRGAVPQHLRALETGRQGPVGYRMHGLFRWSSKWWPGVIPLAIVWALAAWISTSPMEADLAARSNAALKDTLLDQ